MPLARRMYDLFEPICLVNYFCDEPNEAMTALGLRTYWDGYFAGRSAPLGQVPAEVVDAAFYSFADGEVARHLPAVWDVTTPDEAYAARQRGCVAALRRILGDLTATPGFVRASELLAEVAVRAPVEGRVMYAALRSRPMPTEPVARLFHAADLLREHRGDGHVAALLGMQIGGTEAHVLGALASGIHPAATFGRLHHLPVAYLAPKLSGLRERGLLDADSQLTEAGRVAKVRIEAVTDDLAEAPYAGLDPDRLTELVHLLAPVSRRLNDAGVG